MTIEVLSGLNLIKSRVLGSMLGLAVGDSLGAAVEILSYESIVNKYGESGITTPDVFHDFPAGYYTDDTQMTLATARGILLAFKRGYARGICDPPSMVYREYLAWLETQDDPREIRAPGNTCLSALRSGIMGALKNPINKGCGGVMRTAPAGLVYEPETAFVRGCEFAAITHGHPLGWLPAGMLAEILSRIIKDESLTSAIVNSVPNIRLHNGYERLEELVMQAIVLAQGNVNPRLAIPQLGEGWVGEEAIAISIYSALLHPNDFRTAVITAVNHRGDSDSTGCICGAIMGCLLGVDSIPKEWVEILENRTEIESLSQEMFALFHAKDYSSLNVEI